MTDTRTAWRMSYRCKRLGLKDRTLWTAILAATGEGASPRFGGKHALRIQQCLAAMDRAPDRLSVTVLNRWGTRSGMRSPAMSSPRFDNWRRHTSRADHLRRSLERKGLLELDAGGWVRGVVGRDC